MGGGGWSAGHPGTLAAPVSNGYASANTDAGRNINDPLAGAFAESWALRSPGNVDWVALQNFASIAVDDLAHIAKSVIEKFYGEKPKYSYWDGCSTGGRQGLMQAQRFPKNYDGILAVAPANNWVTFLVAEFWGQLQMVKEGYFPPPCEFKAIQEAAIEECDELDGVKDGVVAAMRSCMFDANSAVGKSCCDGKKKITQSAAKIANLAYAGPKKDGKQEWFGISHESAFGPLEPEALFGGLLKTLCDENNENCKPSPFPISHDWIRLFLAKDPDFDPLLMTEDDFFDLLYHSRQRYGSIMDTGDADLSAFRAAGGKMITWHGLADQLIYPDGMANYYERVLEHDPKAQDFYRYFEAPGVEHCVGGPGAHPRGAWQSLVDWVEKGMAPDSVEASTMPTGDAGQVTERILCPYPQVAAYIGGDPNKRSSFKCSDEFGKKKATFTEHNEL